MLDSCYQKGNAQGAHPRGKIPMHYAEDGLIRSSDEVPVMGMERRG